ncbi:hypothetical protein ACVGV4_00655, partial [Enterobacter hormaechei]
PPPPPPPVFLNYGKEDILNPLFFVGMVIFFLTFCFFLGIRANFYRIYFFINPGFLVGVFSGVCFWVCFAGGGFIFAP